MANRLETAFHETFSLSRPEISQVMSVVAQLGEDQSLEKALHQTSLGTRQIMAMKRFGWGSGLLTQKYVLTPFGKKALHHDPLLGQIQTQWLMHFFLSSPCGPGPAFWHKIVVKHFRSGDQFCKLDLIDEINSYLIDIEKKELKKETIEEAIRTFLRTYINRDGLSALGILEPSDDMYIVREPDTPPTWAVACALIDLWHRRFAGQKTVSLSELYGEKGLSSVFMMGKGRLNAMLEEMQAEGMIELYRIAPPYQVVLLEQDMEAALERLYGANLSA